jgi:flagellar motility protein MotE (MotC chaperone)
MSKGPGTSLASRKAPARQSSLRGFRLVDGVVIAAVALLALKVLGLLSWVTAPPEPATASGNLPPFARVLAHARTNYEPPDVTTTGSVPEKKAEPAPPPQSDAVKAANGTASAVVPSESERSILERLGERREELRVKARDAEAREKLIEESERRLDSRLGELKALQLKAEPSVEKKAEIEAAGLKNLVTMYESMKPKEAARVFDRLPQAVLVPVVVQMNPRKMAEVLAAMSPASAEKLTVALANRGKEEPVALATTPALPPGELPGIDPAPARRRP